MHAYHPIIPTCTCMYVHACTCSTLEQRAKRLFMTKAVPLAALDTSLFAKTKSLAQEAEAQQEVAKMEAMVYKYSELLGVSGEITHLLQQATHPHRSNELLRRRMLRGKWRERLTSWQKSHQNLRGRGKGWSPVMKMKMVFLTTPRTFPWDGTGNPSLTGSTNSMAST